MPPKGGGCELPWPPCQLGGVDATRAARTKISFDLQIFSTLRYIQVQNFGFYTNFGVLPHSLADFPPQRPAPPTPPVDLFLLNIR